jgi:hypothetical protein
MTTLHDVLADLAEDAPAVTPDPALWSRTRRRHRVRRRGSVAIVLAGCLALVTLALTAWRQAEEPVRPASSDSRGALPSRLYAPSPWLPGTDEKGPLGRLSMVVWAERKSWNGASEGIVGISATTGEYRFLDLPDSDGLDTALSPDGTRVAYWLAGSTPEAPNSDGDGGRPTVGVGIYDARTGSVVRHRVSTAHGLMQHELAWADNGRLLFEYGQYTTGEDDDMSGFARNAGGLRVWDVDSDREPAPVTVHGKKQDASFAGTAGDGSLVLNDGSETHFVLVDLDRPRSPRELVLPGRMSSYPTVTRDGRAAGVWAGPDRDTWRVPNEVLAGSADDRADDVRMRKVPSSAGTYEVIAWAGPDRIVVLRSPDGLIDNADLELMDVRTGKTTTVLSGSFTNGEEYATELFAVPSRDFPAPPTPLDPRLVVGLGAGVVAAVALALVLWRRRVRP